MTETVNILLLLAEDEDLIRMHLAEELTDGGFELVVAVDGTQAMAELEADATRFRGVLTTSVLAKARMAGRLPDALASSCHTSRWST